MFSIPAPGDKDGGSDGGGFSWSAGGEDSRPKGMAWRIVETEKDDETVRL